MKIFRAAVELAAQGDKQSRDWLSNLILPKEPDKEGIVEDRIREVRWRKITPEEAEEVRIRVAKENAPA